MTTDAGARAPKYYRVKEQLLELTRTLGPDAPIPAERSLAVALRTSRTTVRRALRELAGEGRLDRVHGKGTFVARPKVYGTLRLDSCAEDLRAQGVEPGERTLDVGRVAADGKLSGLLGVGVGEPVLRVERLLLADGEPLAIETTHRNPGAGRATEGEVTVETTLATPYEAALLHTDVGQPMLLVTRHSRTADGEPVDRVRSVYRGARYRFVTTLLRATD
ncbi:HTH-type transcriptional repressor dasR [Streptomyces davaonensis JCM 4913]|uniref:HTH-type transcriptional repressor dasR n=2 Tax=Streptomyces davaonensis TaxID=348043 RepID=K4R0T1_STRDJ|nr:GntR family transcriptional regulator [Streptomyces davaonensis]CCK26715.1 HTH-type transcriptional repressor dasR [Streptomyces davaonensis JCM 4913]